MFRSLLAATLFVSLLLPAAAAATVQEPKGAEMDLTQGVTLDTPTKYMLKMMQSDPSDLDIKLAQFAHMEYSGFLPQGFTDGLAESAQQPRTEKAPTRFFRDLHVICDVDDDGVQDLIINEINQQTAATAVYAFSGVDGVNIWFKPGLTYIPSAGGAFNAYVKPGMPLPRAPENLEPTLDVNDDGVCDLIVFGSSVTRIAAAGQQVITITQTFQAINGSQAYYLAPVFWSFSETATFVAAGEPLFGACIVRSLRNFVTAFDAGFTPNGHRLVVKTTDGQLELCQDPFNICQVYDWRTGDHIQYRDSRTAKKIWQRDLNMTRDDDVTGRSADRTGKSHEKVNNITYYTGMAELGGDDEAEIVLHQFQFTTPRTCDLPPVAGATLFRYGTSMSMLALRGDRATTGADLWRTLVYDSGTYQVNVQFEESFETLIWIFAQILPDMTGDAKPEVFATYLMQERNSPTSVNGAFRTHIHPLDGATGKKLLGPNVDLKQQGWGFAAGLGTDPSKPTPFFAFGSVDIPTGVSPGGRFPPKDVRIGVFDITDGSPVWSWREQFAQDSYLSFQMSLNQYINSLAPYDYNEDGLRDLLTPAQYVQPGGTNQTLLSQAEHTYQTLNSADGAPLHTVRAWGPSGVAQVCGVMEPEIVVFSGHSRRIDVTRFAPGVGNDTVTQLWRHPIYNNPDFTAATQGIDIVSWGNKCVRDQSGRIAFITNPELFSNKRGIETLNVFGFVADNGGMEWQMPPVAGKPPISLEELLRYFEVETPSPALTLAITAGPIAPGLVAGIGLSRLRRKGGL